jgi:hypothetical protein
MTDVEQVELGSVVSLWRYPVKSMMGEELNAVEVMERGLLGDRAYALIDGSDGKARRPPRIRGNGRLFDFRASFTEPVRPGGRRSPRRVVRKGPGIDSWQLLE